MDSGSTRNLIDQQFFHHNFSSSILKRTNVTLKYAAEGKGERIEHFVNLHIAVPVDGGALIFHQPFLLVPNIRFDVYLGQSFIMSKGFGMYHPEFIFFTPPGHCGQTLIQDRLLEHPEIQRANLTYLSKETYLEATKKANKGDQTPSRSRRWRYKPHREPHNSPYSPSGAQPQSPHAHDTPVVTPPGQCQNKPHPAELHNLDTPFALDKPPDFVPEGKGETGKEDHLLQSLGKTTTSSNKKEAGGLEQQYGVEFEREMERFGVGPEERSELWKTYSQDGEAAIPISNYVKEVGKVDTFYEDSEIYYTTLDDLVKVLNISHLPSEPRAKMVEFLRSNMDLFSRHDLDIGTVKDYEAKVTMNTDVSQSEMKYVGIAKNLRARVKRMLRRYEDNDIIQEVGDDVLDPLISNLIALMKGPDKIRIVLDTRLPNHLSKKTKSTRTSLFETLYSVDLNSTHFTTVDLSSSYYSIKLHPDSYRFFCFYFGDKLFNLKRCPMGYSGSHNYLARVLNKIFPCKNNLRIYLDDLIITHQGTLSEAVQDVIEVLAKLKAAGFKVSPKKAALFRTSVVFLGFLLKRGTICIPDLKIQGFNAIPPPSNRLALRKFINSLSFFRTNIPNFSELAADLTELVNRTDRSKKGYVPFQFTAEHLKQFNHLKEAARKSLPLYQTDFDKPIYCFSDSSRKSASFVAFQLDTNDAA